MSSQKSQASSPMDWKSYPITLPQNIRHLDNVYELLERLKARSGSLFVEDGSSAIELEVTSVVPASGIEMCRETALRMR
jgi:hypothetical protein